MIFSNQKNNGPLKMDRRNFIQSSAVLTGGFTFSPMIIKAEEIISTQLNVDDTLYWYQKPLRIMHTVLREIDAKAYNADAVIDYLKKGSYNSLCVNAGGIVDFFQNPLPGANINKLMGDRDILEEISSACKKAGIKVIARIDFRGSEEHVFQKFPDWYMKDKNQKPVLITYTKPHLYESCYLGKHRNEYLNEYITYVLKNYEVDGIWHNAPGFKGICYCERCQASYNEKNGKALPDPAVASESEMEAYQTWKRNTADAYMNKIKQTVKSFGNDKVYTAEVFSMYGASAETDSGIDLRNARDHFDILVSVAFLTGGGAINYYYDLNYGCTIIKFLKSMVPEREAVVMYGGNGTSHRLVIDPKIDLKVWLWQILSAGGRFWNCYFTNVPTQTHDNRNAFNETEIYQFVKTNEKLLEQHVPVSKIGIYYSGATRLSYHKKSMEEDQFGTDIRGFENVVMENHIPNDFILDDQITVQKLKKYKVVILPNVRCMSDAEVEMLKNYVREGGNIIATYITSLYDEKGRERKDFALSEVFGVNYVGRRENTMRDNYQYILDTKHPLVADDSPYTELLFNAGFTSLCKASGNSNVICTWVPTIENQPPDKSWVEKFSTEYPTIVENFYGKGKVIYFANQPDVLSYTVGHQDCINLLKRSIRYLAGDAIQLTSNAPASVNIGLTRSLIRADEYILSFVNTTSGPVRPIRELIPVNDINVNVKLEGRSVSNYKVLRCQGKCDVQTREQTLSIKLSRLEDFAAVFIKMNG